MLGVPLRVTLGKKSLENGGVELKWRRERDAKKSDIVALDRAAAQILDLVERAMPAPSKAA